MKYQGAASWRDVGFVQVPIQGVSERRSELTDDPDIPLGSVHFTGEVTARDLSQQVKGKTYLAVEGDLVYSKIDARNGAVGVVPQDTVLKFTTEYPIFRFDSGAVLSRYAAIACRSDVFLSQLVAASVGHTGRKRVPPEAFEQITIPVPPTDVQREIVVTFKSHMVDSERHRYDADRSLVDVLDRVLSDLGLNVAHRESQVGWFAVPSLALERWSVGWAEASRAGLTDELTSDRYPMVSLGDSEIAEISYGITKSPTNRPGENARPYLRVANVQAGLLDLREIKYIEVSDDDLSKYLLHEGDLLLCEGNSPDLVGRPALWRGEIDGCVHQNHVLRVRPNPGVLKPAYLLAYMQTRAARTHFQVRAKQTTNLATINKSDVESLRVPLPDVKTQERVASEVAAATRRRQDLLTQAEQIRERAWRSAYEAIGGALARGENQEGIRTRTATGPS